MSASVAESDSEEEEFVFLDRALDHARRVISHISRVAREGVEEAVVAVVLTAQRIVANTTIDEDAAAVEIALRANQATEGEEEMAIDGGTLHGKIV